VPQINGPFSSSVKEVTEWVSEKLALYAEFDAKDILLHMPLYFYRERVSVVTIDEIAGAIRGDFDIDADLAGFLKSMYGKKKRFWWRATANDIADFILEECNKAFFKDLIMSELINLINDDYVSLDAVALDAHLYNDLKLDPLDIDGMKMTLIVDPSLQSVMSEEKLTEFYGIQFATGREMLDLNSQLVRT